MTSTQLLALSEPARRPRAAGFRRLMANPTGAAALVFLVLIVLLGAFASLLAPHNLNTATAADVLGPLSSTHPLGSDSAGRDVLSRLLYGTRNSLLGALLATAVAAVFGVTSGLIAGYYARWFDTLATWAAGLLQSLPGMVVLLAARAVLGPSIWMAMAIFGVLLTPAFFRLVYASVTAVRNELYVDAARVFGIGDARIIARHILTVVRAPALVQAANVAGIAIGVQSGLEFLGLGDLSLPTWGSMLNDGFANIYSAPVLMLWPSLAIALTCISLVLLANALRDVLQRTGAAPRRARRRVARHEAPDETEPTLVHEEQAGDLDAAPGEELLRLDRLGVGYDQPDGSVKIVVSDVSLTVHRGEVHGLIGESGSGKTQTAWSVLQLLPEGGRITSGSIVFDGTELTRLGATALTKLRGTRIAYIPQEPMSNLDPSFTIGSQLVEPLRLHLRLSRRQARERALELLGKVGIREPERTFAAYPHEISGGMAQRVLIARAISCEPDLLIADEPTTALDVTVQADVLELLRELQKEMRMGMILVTHNFGVVADLCDRVSVMRAGRIVETGPVLSVFDAPQHPYTRSLFDAILEGAE